MAVTKIIRRLTFSLTCPFPFLFFTSFPPVLFLHYKFCDEIIQILDEPTNYLDREALGALSKGLNEWGGAVIMISHNR